MTTSKFTSIRYPLAIDAGVGRLATEDDYERHVEQLMRQVLLTNPGERINRPDFGCGVRRQVFAPNSDATADLLRITIMQALEKWLGTVVKVNDVATKAADSTLTVRVSYVLLARRERRFLNLEVPL